MLKDNVMLSLQFIMFIMMAMGYFCGKTGMLTSSGRQELTNIFVNVVIPCNIFSSFCTGLSLDVLKDGFVIIFIYFAYLTGCCFLGKVLYQRFPDGQRRVLRYATMISNANFMGLPLVQGVYGDAGLLYASMALLPAGVFTWSIGLAQFTPIHGKESVKKIVTHPCILATLFGILVMLLGIECPKMVKETVSMMGQCVMPVSMLLIGSILSELKISSLLDWKALFYSGVRLVAIPGFLLIVLKLFQVHPLVTGVSVILAGMPAGTVTAILAAQYGADAKFASKCIFVSTLFSIITLPLLFSILQF